MGISVNVNAMGRRRQSHTGADERPARRFFASSRPHTSIKYCQ